MSNQPVNEDVADLRRLEDDGGPVIDDEPKPVAPKDSDKVNTLISKINPMYD